MDGNRLGYTAFMILAAVGFFLTRRLAPGRPSTISRSDKLILTLSAFIGGSLLAKLPFLWEEGGTFWNLSAWAADGKTLTTGLVGAYLSVELAKLILGIREKTGDNLALPLAVALAIGRWGCFVNGCCAGQETAAWCGVDFGDGLRRHPTQIYESLFHLAWVPVLVYLNRRDLLRQQRLKFYLLGYCGYRFAIEFVRIEPVYWRCLTYYQIVVTLFAVFLSVQWRVDAKSKKAFPRQ